MQNCIGAIDGSHVPVTRTPSRASPWRNRKGSLSQNAMFACDFDLNITFISCGWEGSASDARVLNSAIQRGFIVPAGKFYLVDGGYGNTQFFLAPYRGVRYHLRNLDVVAGVHKTTWNCLIIAMLSFETILSGFWEFRKNVFLFSKLAHSTKYGIKLRYQPLQQYSTISSSSTMVMKTGLKTKMIT
jgi:hypothetical protein